MKTCTCSCCGADINAPQFFNGKAYGYTCVTKVAPKNFKRTKEVYVELELAFFKLPENSTRISKLVAIYEGRKINLGGAYCDRNEVIKGEIKNLTAEKFTMADGKIYVSEKCLKGFA